MGLGSSRWCITVEIARDYKGIVTFRRRSGCATVQLCHPVHPGKAAKAFILSPENRKLRANSQAPMTQQQWLIASKGTGKTAFFWILLGIKPPDMVAMAVRVMHPALLLTLSCTKRAPTIQMIPMKLSPTVYCPGLRYRTSDSEVTYYVWPECQKI